jgi:hypothetical protein
MSSHLVSLKESLLLELSFLDNKPLAQLGMKNKEPPTHSHFIFSFTAAAKMFNFFNSAVVPFVAPASSTGDKLFKRMFSAAIFQLPKLSWTQP